MVTHGSLNELITNCVAEARNIVSITTYKLTARVKVCLKKLMHAEWSLNAV
jgi:hypothetical protein